MPKKTKLKNSNKMDMINGPIWNKLPRFALPVAATAILEQLFNASDIAETSRAQPKRPRLPPSERTAR